MTLIAGLVLLLLGLLPVANWIPGGHEAPWYPDRLDLWLSGGTIVLGVAVLAVIVLRKRPGLWPAGAWDRIAREWQLAGFKADVGIAAVAGVAYAVVAREILSARPLLIDEIIQVYQARIFASGRLWLPAPEHPEFTSAMHLIDHAGKVYGQFPAGGPAMLMLGTLAGAEWLVGPLFGAASVLILARLLRRIEAGRGAALAALLLFAFAPFTLFLGGSMMNHVTVLTWLLGAALALVIATSGSDGRPSAALVAGLCLGVAASIRPMDALAFALPTAGWLLWRARHGGRNLVALLASGVGVAIPVAALLAVNAEWTGDPLRFGYIELWGRTHELGFHEAPWGLPHTPARGLELVSLYLLRLQTYFLETPVPSLLFATAALLLVRRVGAFDRWVLASSLLLLVFYWAYWHDGFYLGPRFVYPLAPWLALWTARLPGVLAERGVAEPVRRGILTGAVASLIIGAVMLLPIRGQQYRNGMLNMRPDIDSALAVNRIETGTVLVRESWGAQVIARLWAAGIGRSDAERIFRTTDVCVLDQELTAYERGGHRDLAGALAAHAADSSRVRGLSFAVDSTPRFLPGLPWRPECVDRLRIDSAGFTVMAPMMLARDRDVLIRRDLGRAPPDARPPFYLLRAEPGIGGALRLERLDEDSLWSAWGGARR